MKEYDKIISELFARHQSVQNAGFSSDAYKPGLDHIREFDAKLGNPASKLRSIHIAGTNGKGSVASMLASAFSATGLSVGLYTSPHISDFRERIKIIKGGCHLIPEKSVMAFVKEWGEDFDKMNLSFFEITTAMAFWWFEKQGVDIAVIETGLGGRLDSTNILDPDLCIITSIGLDHCAILGNTRAEIAAEKAGIFKEGVPAIIGTWDEETAPVFEQKGKDTGCPVLFADKLEADPSMTDISKLDLRGDYQSQNLQTVIAALTLLRAYYGNLLVPPVLEAIRHTAEITGLRGRWEMLRRNPDMICDIGHNPPALKENFAQLRQYLDSGKYIKLIMVYGIMADKALDDIIPLMPEKASYIFVTPQTPRALPADMLAESFKHLRPDCEEAIIASSVEEGLRIASAMAESETLIYIGGSTFVVADAIKAL